MFMLRVLVRVREDKRRELIQSLSSFVAQGDCRPSRRLVLEDVSDQGLVCWMGEWPTHERLDEFMQCPTYRALRGAAGVLGRVDEEQIVQGEMVAAEP